MDQGKDSETRLPPSSSVILSLESLVLPSPVYDSFPPPNASTSGEIPIFLSPALAEAVHSKQKQSSENSDIAVEDHLYRLNSEGVQASESAGSSYTINTFGVPAIQSRTDSIHGDTQLEHGGSVFSVFDNRTSTNDSMSAMESHDFGLREHSIDSPSVDSVNQSQGFIWRLKNESDLRFCGDLLQESDCTARTLSSTPSIAEYTESDSLVPDKDALPLLRYRCASASGLVGSSAAATLGESRRTSLAPGQSNAASTTCLGNILHGYHDQGSTDSRRQLAIAATLATLEARCSSAPCSPNKSLRLPASCAPSSVQPQLPHHLTRLLNSAVELLIDQEGFRSALAQFTVYAIQDPKLTPPHRQEMAGMVLFKPIQRQRFPFHYAPIEGQPVLRRLTIEGEPTRDYLSRQASLSLKSNGVYFVRGTERSVLATVESERQHEVPDSEGLESKLTWLFEYSVDDRVVRSSGKFLDGEKILTPLSFACSPLLLHPVQGRKIRLLHVIKKALIPNLAAEKLLPPTGLLSTPSPVCEPQATLQTSNERVLHRRSQSSRASNISPQSVVCEEGKSSTKTLTESSRRTRRRASSADEQVHPRGLFSDIERQERAGAETGRHIISPSQLARLFEGGSNTTAGPGATMDTHTVSTRPLSYVPLAPRPRFHNQLRQ